MTSSKIQGLKMIYHPMTSSLPVSAIPPSDLLQMVQLQMLYNVTIALPDSMVNVQRMVAHVHFATTSTGTGQSRNNATSTSASCLPSSLVHPISPGTIPTTIRSWRSLCTVSTACLQLLANFCPTRLIQNISDQSI